MSHSGLLLLLELRAIEMVHIYQLSVAVSGQLYTDRLPEERAKRVGQCVLSASK